mgnify:CR=1 FL=1
MNEVSFLQDLAVVMMVAGMVMVGGRLYDGGTLDEVFPRVRKLPPQPWAYTPPVAGAGIGRQ